MNNMHTYFNVFILMVAFSSIGFSQECDGTLWSNFNERDKAIFITGYGEGVNVTLKAVVTFQDPSERLSEDNFNMLKNSVLPKKLEINDVVSKIDKFYASNPENSVLQIKQVFMLISASINGVSDASVESVRKSLIQEKAEKQNK